MTENKLEARLTIITPTIEREVLARCCESINQQKYENWEHLVIIDDVEITIDVSKPPYAHPNRKFFTSGKRHHDVGNHARFILAGEMTGDYVLYLDDDNYYIHSFVFAILNDVIDDAAWAVFPIMRFKKYFMNIPPGLNRTDLSQVIHKPIVQGEKICYPDCNRYDADGLLVEQLKKLIAPRLLEYGPLVVYEKANGKR